MSLATILMAVIVALTNAKVHVKPGTTLGV